jgi:exodeoxyribonuclease V alpha subunit
MSETITGVIERITFHNPESGYCVLRVQARGQRDLVTVVGSLLQVVAGEYIEAQGEWVVDRQHGPQFKAETIRTTAPHTVNGIVKYLGSGLVKGIGPKYAQKIVDVFGEKTLEVIDQSPTFLSQVKGLGPKRIARIREGWKEQQGVRAIMVFLQSYGLGTARATRIYKTYGDTAIEQVRANPYRLSTDIWGVGFRTADELAQQLGIPRDSPLRAKAAVRHCLQEAASQGHVCLPEPALLEQTIALTQIEQGIIQRAIEDLRLDDELVRDTPSMASGKIHRVEAESQLYHDPLLYLKPLHAAELGVARALQALRIAPHPLPVTDTSKAINWVEAKMGLQFASAQREAVEASLSEKVLILTGGPGTGKTTIVRAIVELFRAKQQRITLCAPTGRAAKRLSESTGQEAKTIHRLLEFDAAIGGFRRSKDHPLDLDLLVVDETSMADIALMNKLLQAVPPWAALVLVGDVDQLPSVGPGSVLKDFIEANSLRVVRLTQVHRQAGSSWIIRAAHAINTGEAPESAPSGSDGDFYFLEVDDENKIVERIITMVKERIPARFQLDSVRDIQVLSPMNKAVVGVKNLNQELQNALNPPKQGAAEVQRFGMSFRIGDKIIQTQNNYQREVFNGDIGRITDIDTVDQVVLAEFDQREVMYEYSDLDEIQLAYCCSIHKSQGSEYPAVIIPVHTTHFIMLQRNLIYTGITRGKKLVVLVGSAKALNIAVRKADTAHRFSLLKWRLQNEVIG